MLKYVKREKEEKKEAKAYRLRLDKRYKTRCHNTVQNEAEISQKENTTNCREPKKQAASTSFKPKAKLVQSS